MKKRKEPILYGIWIVIYIVAVLLSLLNQAQGAVLVLMQLYSLAFFIPGAILAVDAVKRRDNKQLKRLRVISILSLALTLALLVANFLSVGGSAQLGRILNSFLILVSAPMLISFNWAVSLFLWACLLMVTIPGFILPREKK